MGAIYDVFRKFPDGQVWVEAVEGMENARKRVMNIMNAEPGEYCVYDLAKKTIVLEVSETGRDLGPRAASNV